MNNIQEALFQTIETITDGKLSKIKFDKTIEAIVVSDEKANLEKSAENAGKVTNLVDRVKKLNIDKIVVNTIAGGAALGVAMKDFGLVKKPVSEQTEDLVDNAIDKASADSYNDDSPTSGSYDEPEFDTHDDDDV